MEKTAMQQLIDWIGKNCFDTENQSGHKFIAIDASELEKMATELLATEKQQMDKQMEDVVCKLPSEAEIDEKAIEQTSFPVMCYPNDVIALSCRNKFIEGAKWMKSLLEVPANNIPQPTKKIT